MDSEHDEIRLSLTVDVELWSKRASIKHDICEFLEKITDIIDFAGVPLSLFVSPSAKGLYDQKTFSLQLSKMLRNLRETISNKEAKNKVTVELHMHTYGLRKDIQTDSFGEILKYNAHQDIIGEYKKWIEELWGTPPKYFRSGGFHTGDINKYYEVLSHYNLNSSTKIPISKIDSILQLAKKYGITEIPIPQDKYGRFPSIEARSWNWISDPIEKAIRTTKHHEYAIITHSFYFSLKSAPIKNIIGNFVYTYLAKLKNKSIGRNNRIPVFLDRLKNFVEIATQTIEENTGKKVVWTILPR